MSRNPLQGTDTPALQALLTIRNGDYTRLPAAISVTLPRELVERILLLLDIKSMRTCMLFNREFNEIIQSSTQLQYFLACEAAGVIDNPQSPLSYAERLEALKKREDAWIKLNPVFKMRISIDDQAPRNFCRANEGVYFHDDDNLTDLNYCHLPSFTQDSPRWIRVPGHGPALEGILVNFTTALYEHDLIANFISYDVGNQGDVEQHSLDFVLLKFSTGEYHPLASCPQIHVQTSPEVGPWAVPRIVGDHLALVVYSKIGAFSDHLFIFDWKTGCKLLQHEAAVGAYVNVDFISPDLLLLPNRNLSHFEIWRLPPPPKLPVQILSLKIPALSPKCSLPDFNCYGAPNQFLHSMPYLPPRPFISSPENSIIIVRLQILLDLGLHTSHSYWHLIMHRRALLDTIQTWTSPSLLEQQVPTWLTKEVTRRQTADPQDGSVRPDAWSELVSMMPDPRSSPRTPDSPAPHISTDSGQSSASSFSTNPSTSQCTFIQVPWEKWGPPISRWFQVAWHPQGRSVGHSNGQRYAFSDPDPRDPGKLIISVADFNPHNIRRNAEMMARLRGRENENNCSNGNNEEFEVLDHNGVFAEEVYMGLKCVVYRAPDEYDFDLVYMDEERLLGAKGWHRSVQFLYIG